jgi:NAD(P)-dependent dehydrogenase (short-subunit alcohol dehydrogenase family)
MDHRKVAIVTGASSGIGNAIASSLERNGYRVFGTSRTNADFHLLDVREDDSCSRLIEKVILDTGRVDVLVNNAGYALLGATEDFAVSDVQNIFETNVLGVFRMTKLVLPHMRNSGFGRIINISSIAGFVPVPFMGLYAASKHSIEGFSQSLDHEVRSKGIRSILIEPGFVRTKIGESMVQVMPEQSAFLSSVQLFKNELDAAMGTADKAELVAVTVLQALSSKSPKLQYTVGRQAALLRTLRRFSPSGIFDRSLRKQFKIA